MSKKSRKGRKSTAVYSKVRDHKQQGKTLIPPFKQIGSTQLMSWRDDRLPTVLWAAIATVVLEREEYLELFRRFSLNYKEHYSKYKIHGLTHTHNSQLSDEQFQYLYSDVLDNDRLRNGLRALLFLKNLPDLDKWQRWLEEPKDEESFPLLALVVAEHTDHQSEKATDLRWFRVLTTFAADMVRYPEHLKHMAEEVLSFPNKGELKAVRPSIRAQEMMTPHIFGDDEWPEEFWAECWKLSKCIIPYKEKKKFEPDEALIAQFRHAYEAVEVYFYEITTTTSIDARKDTVFGLVLYGLNLAMRAGLTSVSKALEGRLSLRTLVETYLTLKYLMSKDDSGLWNSYRVYGNGQAKLSFLKMLELEEDDLPDYVTLDGLEDLANADTWQEFTEINIGAWSNKNLRKMSEEAGCKEIYDKYYVWPSGYVHGHWGAVRDTVYTQCLNPLHRFHRVPTKPRDDFASVTEDVTKISNLLLECLNQAYPSFKLRLKQT